VVLTHVSPLRLYGFRDEFPCVTDALRTPFTLGAGLAQRRRENRRLACRNLAPRLAMLAPARCRLPVPVLEQAREAAGIVEATCLAKFADRQRGVFKQVPRTLHA